MKSIFRPFVLSALLFLSACSSESISESLFGKEAEINTQTKASRILLGLPVAEVKPVVAVYDFSDQTGQHKPNDRIAEFSRAVTQGGTTILMEALTKAGSGNWFRVIERSGLDHLLKERQIIAATREQYGAKSAKLPPMLYAGLLLEGGIVSYETNTMTGGLGARYLGIGGNSEYRQDIVTVYLRAVNVQNGEVLISVNTAKTIYSSALSASTFKFVAFDEILELETGVTVNEPPQFAVRQAIESAVYSLIMEGAIKDLWNFADADAGQAEIQRYMVRTKRAALPKTEEAAEEEVIAEEEPAPLPAPAPAMEINEKAKPAEASFLDRVVREEKAEPSPQQVPSTATLKQQAKPSRYENRIQEQPRTLSRPTPAAASEAPRELEDPRTNMYCTQSGCYPFPPNGGN